MGLVLKGLRKKISFINLNITLIKSVKVLEAAGERCFLQKLFLNHDRCLSWNFHSKMKPFHSRKHFSCLFVEAFEF